MEGWAQSKRFCDNFLESVTNPFKDLKRCGSNPIGRSGLPFVINLIISSWILKQSFLLHYDNYDEYNNSFISSPKSIPWVHHYSNPHLPRHCIGLLEKYNRDD
jgi:hypothetical protein